MTMFHRISHRIALQFTAFVLALLLINGALFLAADYENARRMTYGRLDRSVDMFLHERNEAPEIAVNHAPPPLRDRIRILGPKGETLFTSNVFLTIPIAEEISEGMNTFFVQEEPYSVLTKPIRRNGNVIGYIQVAGSEFGRASELPRRILIYIMVCAAISLLIFWVGLTFARRSLKPAEDTMERLEQFTQDASHELRTPLATLNSSLDLALKTKEYKSGIESAKEDIQKISKLVEKLLELARLDGLLIDLEAINVSEVIDDTIKQLTPLAQEKQISLDAAVAPHIMHKADPALVRQILTNLLTNAIKFTPQHGTVHITLEPKLLRVADSGPGIPEKDLAHIFDRFYQADDSRSEGGFGLGLSVVRRIADLHNWKVRAENSPQGGAIFTVEMDS